ncbi:unnamed protein product [Schistocephalus solidus]|uniref:C2H2-type domain-containing protein n=1 Tax=Schistocephalus solidus TaxID=70667 RepID=A0A183TMZ4_SCHSO|nr:unnamed protein product [Schistocephalus solidus]
MQSGAALYEADRIAAAKAKMTSRKSQATRININAQALSTCPCRQRTFRTLIGLVGHLRTQCNNNHTISTSATPASDPTTTKTTPTTDNNFVNAPPHTITDTILPPLPLALIMETNTTCPTPTTSVATSGYLPPATSNTTAAHNTGDGDNSNFYVKFCGGGEESAIDAATLYSYLTPGSGGGGGESAVDAAQVYYL